MKKEAAIIVEIKLYELVDYSLSYGSLEYELVDCSLFLLVTLFRLILRAEIDFSSVGSNLMCIIQVSFLYTFTLLALSALIYCHFYVLLFQCNN